MLQQRDADVVMSGDPTSNVVAVQRTTETSEDDWAPASAMAPLNR